MRLNYRPLTCLMFVVSTSFCVAPLWSQTETLANEAKPETVSQPQIDMRLGHGGTVRAVTVSADGNLVASLSDDKTIKLWDRSRNSLRRTIDIAAQSVNSIALSPNGETIVAATERGVLRWAARSGASLSRIGVQLAVNAVAFSPDGKTLASGGDDGKVRLWDSQSGALMRTLESAGQDTSASVANLSFSADGSRLLSTGAALIKRPMLGVWTTYLAEEKTEKRDTVAAPKIGALVDQVDGQGPAGKFGLKSGDIILEINGHTLVRQEDWLRGLNLSAPGTPAKIEVQRDEKIFAMEIVPAQVTEPSDQIKATLWNIPTAKPLQVLAEVTGNARLVALSPDGTQIGSSDNNGCLLVWDVQSKKPKIHTSGIRINAIGWAPDGKTVVALSGIDVVFQDVQSGVAKRQITQYNTVPLSLAISANGKTLATGGIDKTVRMLDPQTGGQEQQFGRDATVFTLGLSPDGSTLAAASGEHVVHLWDVQSGELKGTLPRLRRFAYAPDSKTLAGGAPDGTIQIYDSGSGVLLRSFANGPLHDMAFSPDGQILATAQGDSEIKLWNPQTGAVRQLTGHTANVMTVAFAPDGKTLLSGSMDGTIKLWNVQSGALLKSWDDHTGGAENARSVIFSPDGKRFADWNNQSQIRIWNVQSGTVERTIRAESHTGCLLFSPDSQRLVGGSYRRVDVWDVSSGALQKTFANNSGWVWSLSFLPDSNILARGGEEQIKLLDIGPNTGRDARELITLYALTPDSNDAASDLKDKAITAGSRAITSGSKAITATSKSITADSKAITAGSKPINAVAIEKSTDYLAITPEGYYTGSPAADRYVNFRLGNDSFPVESFQAHYYRPDLVIQALKRQTLPKATFRGPVPPLVAFADQNQKKVSGANAIVTVEASDDSEVRTVRFYVDGAPVEAKPINAEARPITAGSKTSASNNEVGAVLIADGQDIPAAHKVTRRMMVSLPLPQDKTNLSIQAVAFDNDTLQSARMEMLVTRDQIIETKGKLLGLCVGISRYQDPRRRLQFADADAKELTRALNTQREFYSGTSVTELTDQEATAAKVKAALENLINQATRNDTVMILLSGHGWREGERKFYFATQELNINDVPNTTLSWSDVAEQLTRLSLKSKRVIILLDACHSGSVDTHSGNAATNDELSKNLLLANTGLLILASSKGSEMSLENAEWGHGAFTKAVLEAIETSASDNNKDRNVSVREFTNYVTDRVKLLTENTQNPQVPLWHDFDADAPLFAASTTTP